MLVQDLASEQMASLSCLIRLDCVALVNKLCAPQTDEEKEKVSYDILVYSFKIRLRRLLEATISAWPTCSLCSMSCFPNIVLFC